MAIMNEFACFDFKEKLKLYALFIINCICSTNTSVMMTIGYKHVEGREGASPVATRWRVGRGVGKSARSSAAAIGEKGSRGGKWWCRSAGKTRKCVMYISYQNLSNILIVYPLLNLV
jgi:hypothetical protein